MDAPTPPLTAARRLSGGWNAGTLTALAVALFVALSTGRDRGSVNAQPAARRAASAAGPHVYRQTQVYYQSIDRTLTEWESKGWETYQIVPIASPNPGSGAAMQVALVFRKPADGGK